MKGLLPHQLELLKQFNTRHTMSYLIHPDIGKGTIVSLFDLETMVSRWPRLSRNRIMSHVISKLFCPLVSYPAADFTLLLTFLVNTKNYDLLIGNRSGPWDKYNRPWLRSDGTSW